MGNNTEKQTDTGRQTDKKTDTEPYIQTDRETVRQTRTHAD